ncbi:putative RNA-directed DNA polymerase [Helianthus annuus]|nr:putative RNA-directed DNA polymerase [Helianthus annuus]KAJ0447655.1 putative RNA-directed DNA polymerase [Helianthus annuus]KAJ0632558.1 putative RNA-directed DNA polymerase [Helianthus annuus]KAJ0826454.1 putative RNA-directed DNA polymerase [Helianthus annuus]
MNFLTLNVRGLGVQAKQGWFRGMRLEQHIGCVLFQETLCSNVVSKDLEGFWGRGGFDFGFVEPTGRSGGLVTMWDTNVFDLQVTDRNRNYVLCSGFIKGSGEVINILNVYAPQADVGKRQLWRNVTNVIKARSGLWVVGGDFNSVRDENERRNSNFNLTAAKDFNDFIEEVGLQELMLRGRKFTFSVGNKLSRIDRFLVCWEFFCKWSDAEYRVLPKGRPDHCPVVLKTFSGNFGPKPFRFFNSWLARDGFEDVIVKANIEFIGRGRSDLILLQKLKWFRKRITEWKEDMKKKELEEELILTNEVEILDVIREERDLTEEEEWVWEESQRRIKEIEDFKYKDLQQKSRCKWAKDGDDNTRYFHGLINKRKATNSIPGLLINGIWETKASKVKKEVHRFFKMKYIEDMVCRPTLQGQGLKRLAEVDVDMLMSQFSEIEVKEAVFGCGDDKAPGPDGFNFKFIKNFWSIFSADCMNIMNEFYETGSISRGVGSSFITLIPKNSAPSGLGDYRPINLIGVTSKVISKVLANRLRKVVGSITSETQSAFLSGRYILDGPMMINEIMAWARQAGKEMFIFKIDFEKAYDNVHWGFLIDMLRQLGFPARWCLWMEGILASARSSVLVNGAPTFEFDCKKGIRQGDPLSPFLFVIVMEALSSIFKKASDIGAFDGIRLPNGGPEVNHFLYADDAMILGEWSSFNFNNLKRMLRIFYLCSGLRINIHKSTLYGMGVGSEDTKSMAACMGCKAGNIPFVYLGIKVGANMNRILSWEPVKEIFRSRLSKWKANVLSIGGRLTLIRSVLESLPTYYFSLYKAPKKIITELEAQMKRFLWGGSDEVKRMHWVGWDKVAVAKNKGGLGLNRLENSNKALVLKWLWRYRSENNALWRKVVDAIHVSARNWDIFPVQGRYKGVWYNVVRLGRQLKVEGIGFNSLIRADVGNGKTIRFWMDPWICEQPLKVRFPKLYTLESEKHCKVSDRLLKVGGASLFGWRWKHDPTSLEETLELTDCSNMLTTVKLSEKKDSWLWHGTGSAFSVANLKAWITSTDVPVLAAQFDWCKWIPLKCNVFMWRALLERLPTKVALIKRNIHLENSNCIFCDDSDETAEHIFTGCFFSSAVWQAISTWCRLPVLYVCDLKDLTEIYKNMRLGSATKEMVQGLMIIGCWRIWKARNDRIFNDKKTKIAEVIADVKTYGYMWYTHRNRNRTCTWDQWCKCDMM